MFTLTEVVLKFIHIHMMAAIGNAAKPGKVAVSFGTIYSWHALQS